MSSWSSGRSGVLARRSRSRAIGALGFVLLAIVLVAAGGGFAGSRVARTTSASSVGLRASPTVAATRGVTRLTSASWQPSIATATVDPYASLKAIPVGPVPMELAYDSAKHELFVANSNADNVSVISDATGTVVATITVGSGPTGVAYDPAKGEIFVAVSNIDGVSVISDTTNTVVTTIGVGSAPSGIAYDASTGEVYVANFLAGTVSVISDTSNAVVATVSVGTEPNGVAYDSGMHEIVVTNFGSNNVSRISDTIHLVTDSVMVGAAPYDVAYDPLTAETYVANFNGSSVTVIPDAVGGPLSTIAVGSHPAGVAYGAGTIFVTNAGSDNASLIADSNHTVVASVGLYVGGGPFGVAYDAGNQGWYIAEASMNAVVVVAPGYDVTFTETGLPASTSWVVYLNGTSPYGALNTSYISSTPTIRMIVPNGSYVFAVRRVTGFVASPASGSVTVSGAALNRSIAFTFPYAVTFTETGLPAGTLWSVTLAGTSETSNTTSITFQQANGTYAFTAGPVTGYDASPSAGNVTVSGAATSKAIAFTVTQSTPPGIDMGLILIVLVVVIVAAAVGAVLFLRMRRKGAPPSSGAPPAEPGTPPQL